MKFLSAASYSAYAPVVLRVGLSLVFLWFGSQQLLHKASWTSFIPDIVVSLSGLSAVTLVVFNGAFEVVFGLALLAGFYTQLSALILALHMFDIAYVVGYDAIGVRDFGLAVATLAIALNATPDIWSVDHFLASRNRTE
ncbi:MAG: DoxX family protein [bacterium]